MLLSLFVQSTCGIFVHQNLNNPAALQDGHCCLSHHLHIKLAVMKKCLATAFNQDFEADLLFMGLIFVYFLIQIA